MRRIGAVACVASTWKGAGERPAPLCCGSCLISRLCSRHRRVSCRRPYSSTRLLSNLPACLPITNTNGPREANVGTFRAGMTSLILGWRVRQIPLPPAWTEREACVLLRGWNGAAMVVLPCGSRNPLICSSLRRKYCTAPYPCPHRAPTVASWPVGTALAYQLHWAACISNDTAFPV